MCSKVRRLRASLRQCRLRERGAEAALSGTAATLAGVGEFVHGGLRVPCRDGKVGANALRLRDALTAKQRGEEPDHNNWLAAVRSAG
jgi:branched-subunit amino acid aminotransferase/4-amino-4-deoxychorismate lyase